jgi:hypothetical protein
MSVCKFLYFPCHLILPADECNVTISLGSQNSGYHVVHIFLLVSSVFESSYVVVCNLNLTVIELQICLSPTAENLSTKKFCLLGICNPLTMNYGELVGRHITGKAIRCNKVW